ncbi:hypothetical protein ACFE04_003230 [Oxalis oulophora]
MAILFSSQLSPSISLKTKRGLNKGRSGEKEHNFYSCTLFSLCSVVEEGLDIRQRNVDNVMLLFALTFQKLFWPHGAFLRNARNNEETLRKEAIERTDLKLKDTSRLVSVEAAPSTDKVESTGAIVRILVMNYVITYSLLGFVTNESYVILIKDESCVIFVVSQTL